ncbi:hypothetical protein G6F62_015842 [Rhizopus arrhizus]|nr:hypothetical protein G6F62_015842 [Rhizopus arrhizus]
MPRCTVGLALFSAMNSRSVPSGPAQRRHVRPVPAWWRSGSASAPARAGGRWTVHCLARSTGSSPRSSTTGAVLPPNG